MNDIVTKEITIDGGTFIGVYKDGKIYTPLRKFCEFLGVNFSGQHQRIQRDETLKQGVCKIHIPTQSGVQEAVMMENSFLPLWLAGIKANQCREEIRDNLIRFKLEVKDILAEAFLGKRENERLENKDWAIDRMHIRLNQCKFIEDQILTLTNILNKKYKEIEDIAKLKQETSVHFLEQYKKESKYDASKETLPQIILPKD